MKKALVFLLIFTIGSVLFAQQGLVQDGLVYEVVDGRSVTITGYTGNATTLNIPAQIQGLPVTVIGLGAFSGCESLTSITIPSSVRSIGDYAFQSCSNLTNVTIPSSVTFIGDFAFTRIDNMTSITIPSSVTSIGDVAFYNCWNLTSITVDNRNSSYASIDGVLFDKNIRTIIKYPQGRNQRTYVIPSSVTSIGNNAFNNSWSLISVTIPSSVTSIRDDAFYNCRSLTSVTIPSSVTAIGDSAFGACRSLTNVTIPSSVTSIGKDAFSGCDSLTSITIPASVMSIGRGAFDCSSLTSVTLSRRTRVGEGTFPETARIIYRD